MLNRTNALLSERGKTYVDVAQKKLRELGKVATELTYNSVRFEVRFNGEQTIELCLFAGEGWKFINDGRPPNSKMPPSIKTQAGRHLKLWFDVKGIPESADYPVRYKIARDGIKPIDLTEAVVKELVPLIREDIQPALAEDLRELGLTSLTEVFK